MLAPRIPLARTAIVRLPPKEADPYYLTPEWRELRRQTLERDGGVCTVPGCGRAAVVADHIVSRKEGGADALHNTRSLCRLHDNRFRKVRPEGAANARRGRGFGMRRGLSLATGRPPCADFFAPGHAALGVIWTS